MLARRASIRHQEMSLGIHTEAVIFLPELGIYNPDCREYGATEYDDFGNIMRELEINPAEHVFLDYGAGMGRVMVLAATYPFKRVMGVEIAPELVTIAQRNINNCRSRVRCQDMTIIISDATKYVPDSDASILFFNQPFTGEILESVLQNIRRFSSGIPPVLLVCNLPKRSLFEDQIRQHDWLELKKEFSLSINRKCLVFSTKSML